MAPIRVGFVGLAATTERAMMGAWGATVHLPGIQSMPDEYEIVAVCNSSVESAQKSIDFHKLGANVKAYGSPTDLANDPNVELAVVSIHVSKHFQATKPLLEAGKMIYSEAPLGASLTEARELAALAKAKGVRTMVGTQGRGSATFQEVKRQIEAGTIGKVTASTLLGVFIDLFGAKQIPDAAKYFLDVESPINSLAIFFHHIYDVHRLIMGEFAQYTAHVESKNATRELTDAKGNVVGTFKATSPDHLMMLGTVDSGALASINLRPHPRPPQDFSNVKDDSSSENFRWFISGTEGEIEIHGPDSFWGASPELSKIFLTKDGKKTQLDIPFKERGILPIAANTAEQYEAFAKSDTTRYADFEDAARLAELIEELRVESRRATRRL